MATPAPHDNARLHNAIELGSLRFPSNADEGAVKVQVKTGVDVDQQKANGKDRAKTKIKGKKVSKISISFQYTRLIYETSDAFRLAIDPNLTIEPGSWEVRHPEISARGINALVITDMSALEIKGDLYSFSVEADGWFEPSQAKLGGAKTPKTAKPASQASPADVLANRLLDFQEALFGAGEQVATAANGINTAAEAIRRAAANQPANPPFQGPDV